MSFRLALLCDFELDDFDLPGPNTQVQASHSNWQVKTTRSGTPRVNVEHAVLLGLPWFMGVPAYHDMKPRNRRVEIQVLQNMQHIDHRRAGRDDFGQRQSLRS